VGDHTAKKAKQNDTTQEDAVEPSLPSDDEDDSGGDESDASESTSFAALAPGPHTFFSWVEALDVLLGDGDDENPFLYLKSMAMEAYSHVAHMEDEQARQDAIGEYLEDMDYWECYPDEDDAGKSSIADALRKKWDEKESEAWWWEVTMQREEPGDSVAALKVSLESGGKSTGWWLTDFRAADEEGDRAMSCISVHNNTT